MFVSSNVQALVALCTGLNFSGIDGTFFTHVEFRHGVALMLVTRDGNNQLVVLAFVICLVEDKANYIYFKEQIYQMPLLRKYLDRPHGLLYSDRQKGLPYFSSGFRNGKGDCIKHISDNTREHCRKHGEPPAFHKNQIFAIQKCRTKKEFEEKMRVFSLRYPEAAAYLYNLQHDTTFLYKIIERGFTTFGHSTSNIAEVGNWVFQPQRYRLGISCVSILRCISRASFMHSNDDTHVMHKRCTWHACTHVRICTVERICNARAIHL